MTEKIANLIAKNLGIIAMWGGATMLAWKVLDRASGWATVAAIFVVVFTGFATQEILNPSPRRERKKKARNNG